MNLIDLVKAHLDGSARPADTKALLDILDRALRSNDNGCELARTVLQTISRTSRHLDAPHWDALVKTLAECHIVTVARLEAERDAALAARNQLERRNLALLKDIENLDTAAYWRSAHAAACRRGVDSADRASKYMRDLVEMDRKYAEQGSELLDERRRHAETAAALSEAKKRAEELSAEIALLRTSSPARDVYVAPARCTCIDPETLDNLAATGPVIASPCPVHHWGKR